MTDKLVEQQREHFDRISDQYFSARRNANHLLLKELIWRNFFSRRPEIWQGRRRILEPMCGMAEGYEIVRSNVGSEFDYVGFDYSERMVEIARREHPQLKIEHGDVTAYTPPGEPFDLILLIGGLHHVFSRTAQILANLRGCLGRGGLFLSFEPTHANFLTRGVRRRIYESNAIFDSDTEQGFEFEHLHRCFREAGFDLVDEVYPGLAAYVLYYNPDAFPALNLGGQGMVRALFSIDRAFWANAIGRKLSFATISVWRRG